MTMETYHWERKHLADQPFTLSVMRTLPEGDWTVRSEELILPPEFQTRYPTLREAMQAADDLTRAQLGHDCRQKGCNDWMPVPPAHGDLPQKPTTTASR